MFRHLIGNEQVKSSLQHAFDCSHIGSFLFHGPQGTGKSLFAKAFAEGVLFGPDKVSFSLKKELVSSHPDLRWILPEGKMAQHSIDSLRQLGQEVYLSPFSSKRKIFIIEEAHRMAPASANALLKTLEEPAAHSSFILITSEKEALLPTIISRCMSVAFKPLREKEIVSHLTERFDASLAKQASHFIASFAPGSIGPAVRYLEDNEIREIKEKIQQNIGALFACLQLDPSYLQMQEIANSLAQAIEEMKKKEEEQLRAELNAHFSGNPSAQERHFIEKSVEAQSSLAYYNEVTFLLKAILHRYRDLSLYQQLLNESPLLYYRESAVNQALESGSSLPFESVDRAIRSAFLSLERSTPLPLILENLFLKLSF